MSPHRNWLIFLAVLVGAGVFYVTAVHGPQAGRLRRLRFGEAELAGRCADDEAKAATIPTLRADVERMKREFSDFDQRLPRQTELAEFLREISAAGEAERLSNQVIKPGNPSAGSLYHRLPIIMDFHCSFTDLVGFLERMKQMTRLTRVEKIQVSPVAGGERLDVRMQVNIYFTNNRAG